jgi:hypothetical protein
LTSSSLVQISSPSSCKGTSWTHFFPCTNRKKKKEEKSRIIVRYISTYMLSGNKLDDKRLWPERLRACALQVAEKLQRSTDTRSDVGTLGTNWTCCRSSLRTRDNAQPEFPSHEFFIQHTNTLLSATATRHFFTCRYVPSSSSLTRRVSDEQDTYL